MPRSLRTLLFWVHLASGLVAGLVIALMSVTGVALAFQPQIVAWLDADARLGVPPASGATRLSVDEAIARAEEKVRARDEKPTGVTVYPEPASAIFVRTGRSTGVYVDAYSGEVRELGAQGARDFFHTMMVWHRWLGADGDGRAVGKAITGACNVAFLLLGITGLVLWLPRKWTKQAVRAVLWFRRGLSGKARDFNWHNVVGFWCLPVLIVLTVSAMVISYRWASDFSYRIMGNEPPAGRGRPGIAVIERSPPAPDATRLPLEALFSRAREEAPPFDEITLNFGAEQRFGDGNTASAFSVRATDRWPRHASLTIWLDPWSGEVVRQESFDDFTPGLKLRTWLRFLHTGEALGWPGQLVAAIASAGGALLVWTGFALAWRRFVAWRGRRTRRNDA